MRKLWILNVGGDENNGTKIKQKTRIVNSIIVSSSNGEGGGGAGDCGGGGGGGGGGTIRRSVQCKSRH